MRRHRTQINRLENYKGYPIYLNSDTEEFSSGELTAISLKALRAQIDKAITHSWKRQPCYTTGRHGHQVVAKGHVTSASPDRQVFTVSFDRDEDGVRQGHQDGVHRHYLYAPSPKNRKLVNEIQTLEEVIQQCRQEQHELQQQLEPFVIAPENEVKKV